MNGDAVGCIPELLVPARRRDARAITAGVGEPGVRPGNPRCLNLDPLERFEQFRVGSLVCQLEQYRGVPCSTDDRDALKALGLRSANRLAHVGLALRLPLVSGWLPVAQGAHRFQNGSEEFCCITALSALLHLSLPPQFGVAVASSLREHPNWVAPPNGGRSLLLRLFCYLPLASRLSVHRFTRQRLLLRLHLWSACELDGLRQVYEAGRKVVIEGVGQRLPFR